MKKIRLFEDALSQSEINTYKNMYDKMDINEKERWLRAVKECVQELGYGKITKSDILTGGFGLALIVIGIKLNIPEVCLMGAGTIGILTHFQKDEWQKIIECARKRMGKGGAPVNTTSIGDTQMQESKMKKTIRLTESELVELVQRIIKEDEMSMDLSMDTSKGITLLQLGVKEPSYMISLKGYTPFYVNGKEQKKNIDIQPTDKLSSKDCMVEFVGNKSNKNFTLVFDSNGKASIRK